jgi:hypothetical protein
VQTSLDGKIAALVPGVTSALQMGLQDVLRTLRDGQNPVGVLLAMSRLRLRLMEEVFAGVGHKLPSDNLYDCIVTAARGDPQKRLTGLRFLPDEMASYLHTLRMLSNKADPPSFPQPVVPRPSHWASPAPQPSALLRRKSRLPQKPRSALLRTAAADDRAGAEAAASAGREEQRPAAYSREAWRKGRLSFLSVRLCPSIHTMYC